MATENERKFLVVGDQWRASNRKIECLQGFLAISKECTTRVRVTNKGSFITVKGPTINCSRQEYEYEIPEEDAREMLALSPYSTITKTRYLVDFEGYTWEVDLFHGDNQGLIMAEVEFSSEEDASLIPIPEWVGREVSEDVRYYNTYLAKKPYKDWPVKLTSKTD